MKSNNARFIATLVLPAWILILVNTAAGDAVTPDALVDKIQKAVLAPPVDPPESKPDTNTPRGEVIVGEVKNTMIYPGMESYYSTNLYFRIYVPAQYTPSNPACLLIGFENLDDFECRVLDSLIAKKEIPVLIAVHIGSDAIFAGNATGQGKHAVQYNRSYMFDAVNNRLADFALKEVLPAVQKLKSHGREIYISTNGNDHATFGISSPGIAAFTLAWQRPDQFQRVYTIIGTFVAMRGGDEYPALIRKTEPKPIRIFMEDGSADGWGSFGGGNSDPNMEIALKFAGYEVAHAWGTHAHDPRPGMCSFADVMRWLWRDYPAPIKAGSPRNPALQEILLPGEDWHKIPQTFQSAGGFAANAKGEVFVVDVAASTIYRFHGPDATPGIFLKQAPAIVGQAFGPDGALYGVVPREKKVIALDAQGKLVRTVAEGIAGHHLLVRHDGTLFVSEPGENSDLPSQIWQINPSGEKKVVDRGIHAATGVAITSDGSLLYAAEKRTRTIYSYLIQPDGSLTAKQPYFWLHLADLPGDNGTEDLTIDMNHNVYAATPLGIQVCDHNGRVRAILPLPTPSGPVRSLCFGGEHFDTLYATDGTQVFTRHLRVPGFEPWSEPIPFATNNAAFNPKIGPY